MGGEGGRGDFREGEGQKQRAVPGRCGEPSLTAPSSFPEAVGGGAAAKRGWAQRASSGKQRPGKGRDETMGLCLQGGVRV